MRTLALAALLIPLTVMAQTEAPPLPTSGFDVPPVTPGTGPILGTDANTLGELRGRVGLALHYDRAPLRLVSVDDTGRRSVTEVISHRLTTQVFAAFGIFSWLDINAQLPVVAYQTGPSLTPWNLSSVGPAGFGSPVFGARVRLLSTEGGFPIELAFQLNFVLPLGTSSALSGNQLAALPSVHVGRSIGWFHLGGMVQAAIRREVVYGKKTFGSELDFSTTAGVGDDHWRVELTGRGSVSFGDGLVDGEVLLGGRVMQLKWFDVFVAAGPAFGIQPGVPTFRVLGGVGTTFGGTEKKKPEPVPEPVDPAPAPIPDRDGDTVPDNVDRCPDEPGPVDNGGCPIPPPPDRDGDTVLDNVDKCPDEPGPVDNEGCPIPPPPPDRDGDTVLDNVDNCPDEPGPVDNEGCPKKEKQLVVITSMRLVIKDKVYFDTGKATIQKRSYPLLDQVASVLVKHPELTNVTIEGHTDNVGAAAMNRRLSNDRAISVMSYLSKRGVDASRLKAKGYGPDRPADTNATPLGREKNRRVEFIIASPESQANPTSTGDSK